MLMLPTSEGLHKEQQEWDVSGGLLSRRMYGRSGKGKGEMKKRKYLDAERVLG